MPDHLKKYEYLPDFDVSLELDYRLNFEVGRSCGYVRVYKGDIRKVELDEGEEAYEIYMELFECGLKEEQVYENYQKVVDEIKAGEIEV